MATKSLTARRYTEEISGSYDWGLITIVTTLLMFGIVIMFSASFGIGVHFDSTFAFASRQLLYLGLGTGVMVVCARLPYTYWRHWAIPIMGVTLLALLAVLTFGADAFNARRTLMDGRIQPGEAAKLGVVIYAAAWLSSKGDRIRQVTVGLIPFSILLGVVGMLLSLQPSYSTAILIVSTAFIMFFIAGAAIKQLVLSFTGGVATFWLVFEYSPIAEHARRRIDDYMNTVWNPLQSEQQQTWQAIEALVRGGVFGRGIGEGTAKLPGYLPVTWQDNIFAVIGEEMGLIGALIVILLFTLMAYLGLRTALRAPDNFGAILATGITTLITLQAVLHMSVTVSIMPATGQPLPFISYGGSSLMTMMAAIGILLSISRGHIGARANEAPATGKHSVSGKTQHARFDLGWRDWGSRLPSAGSTRTIDAHRADPGVAGRHSDNKLEAGPGFLARIRARLTPPRRPTRTRRRV